MADTHEKIGGMLIFCVCFLAFFIALVGVGNDFFVNSTSYRNYITSDLDASNLLQLNQTIPHNVTRPSTDTAFDFAGGVELRVNWFSATGFQIVHCHGRIGGWWYSYGGLKWDGDDQDYLTPTEMLTHWDDATNSSLWFPVNDEDLTVHAWFSDHNTTRNDLEEAVADNKVCVSIGFGYNDYKAKLSAWDIIARLLLFQAPTIIGLEGDMGYILGVMVSIALWTCIAYLIYRIILMAIPFMG